MSGGAEEFYTSPAFELPRGARLRKIYWDADVPPKTWVKARICSALSRTDLVSAWQPSPHSHAQWLPNHQDLRNLPLAGPFIGFQLALGAVNSGRTPRVRQVTMTYDD